MAEAEKLQAPFSKPDDEIKAFQSCFGQFMLVRLGNKTKEIMLSVLATFSKSKSESFVIRDFTKTLRDILFPYFLISLKQYFSIQDGYILVPAWPSNTDWMIQLESHAEWDKVLVNLF